MPRVITLKPILGVQFFYVFYSNFSIHDNLKNADIVEISKISGFLPPNPNRGRLQCPCQTLQLCQALPKALRKYSALFNLPYPALFSKTYPALSNIMDAVSLCLGLSILNALNLTSL